MAALITKIINYKGRYIYLPFLCEKRNDFFLRLFFSFIIIFLLLFVSVYKSYVAVNYIFNLSTIENNYCVNKNLPELNCHGKCYLSLNLNKFNSSHHSSDFFVKLSTLVEKEYFPISYLKIKWIPYYFYLLNRRFMLNYKFIFSEKFFHPPLCRIQEK